MSGPNISYTTFALSSAFFMFSLSLNLSLFSLFRLKSFSLSVCLPGMITCFSILCRQLATEIFCPEVVRFIALHEEGAVFDSAGQFGAFLCRIFMFSLCLRGFSPGALFSTHCPKKRR